MWETLIIPVNGKPYVAGIQLNSFFFLKSLVVLILQFCTSSSVHI